MYQLRRPDPALAPYIEHYWFVTPDDGPVSIRVEVFVDARADLIFNFDAPYRREVIGGAAVQLAQSNLDAQRTVPIRIVQEGSVRITGVRFKVGGLAPFAIAPLGAFTDHTPPPSEVLGPDASALEASLRQSADVDAHARALDAFFLAHRSTSDAHHTFEKALAQLVEHDGGVTIEALAHQAGISARHLDRLFGRHLGLPPKTVARVLRFQRALRALMSTSDRSLADVAADAGYFDQAHFIKDFKRMSGGVPRGYRGYYPPAGPADFAPNVVVFLQELPPPSGEARPANRQRSERHMGKHWSGKGTKDDPWKLKTPPLTSDYEMYRDDSVEPPLLVCQVGSTKLTYLARCLDDVPAMLKKHGDWMVLGAADEKKDAAEGTLEAWGRSPKNPVGGWYGQKKGYRGRFGLYVPPLLEALGKVELEHNPKNNRVRAK